jgi:hypothetical protein
MVPISAVSCGLCLPPKQKKALTLFLLLGSCDGSWAEKSKLFARDPTILGESIGRVRSQGVGRAWAGRNWHSTTVLGRETVGKFSKRRPD